MDSYNQQWHFTKKSTDNVTLRLYRLVQIETRNLFTWSDCVSLVILFSASVKTMGKNIKFWGKRKTRCVVGIHLKNLGQQSQAYLCKISMPSFKNLFPPLLSVLKSMLASYHFKLTSHHCCGKTELWTKKPKWTTPVSMGVQGKAVSPTKLGAPPTHIPSSPNSWEGI